MADSVGSPRQGDDFDDDSFDLDDDQDYYEQGTDEGTEWFSRRSVVYKARKSKYIIGVAKFQFGQFVFKASLWNKFESI